MSAFLFYFKTKINESQKKKNDNNNNSLFNDHIWMCKKKNCDNLIRNKFFCIFKKM